MGNDDYSLIIDGVTKRFGAFTAVDDLSLRIPRGAIYGFLGPNGAGKTTTIRMIMSIIYPDSGRIEILGHPRAEEVKDRLGYLPEEKGLYKKMRAGEIITYFGRLKGMSGADARRRARELLDRYGLPDWFGTRCESLSKGMGQKVQIMASIVHDPELVIFDEPFSGLDPVNVELMRDLILDLKRQGKTVIFSTHVMEQAEQICDFIFLIDRGKKVLDGPLSAVRRSGGESIKIDYDGDGEILRRLPGVARVNDAGKTAELFLEPDTDPQSILSALVGKLSIRRFDLSEPSLHEIFVRSVKRMSHE
ncbi:MAG: ATP-binding cassette domain-containing protein [Planctomycetes bacterium]|nr:ATP-binding cassette domain-containing protein [Planctomycetota bacterium]